MTKKATITAAAMLLFVGIGAIALVNRDPAATQSNADSSSGSKSGNSVSGSSATSEASRAARAKPRDPADNPEFVTKYGESRTNLSKHVATNIMSLLDDAIDMGEMASTGGLSKAFGGPRAGLRMGLGKLGRDLNLTDEQQEKAAVIYADFQKRQLEKTKASVESLKKDPTALMGILLASDSFSRGKMPEEEYKQTQAAAANDLKGVMNPLDRKNFEGGKPTRDETFCRDFQALLEPSQIETYQDAAAAEQANPTEKPNAGDISNIPAMELEKLDETVVSAKKLTGGLKQMMEGMGGLQELGPLMEQQRKQAPPVGQ